MKNIRYVIFMLLLLFLNIFYVHASCTNEEIFELNQKVSEIEITYKQMGKVETIIDDVPYINYYGFDITVKNVYDDFYISIPGSIQDDLVPTDGTVITSLNNGKWNFEIYSKKCNVLIDEIEVFLPRFNLYSLDSLCEGIDGDDFPLCGKYYEYDISYERFVERVTQYRDTHDIETTNNDDDNSIQDIAMEVINYVINHKYYFLGCLGVLLLILTVVLILKKRKKRGVLE